MLEWLITCGQAGEPAVRPPAAGVVLRLIGGTDTNGPIRREKGLKLAERTKKGPPVEAGGDFLRFPIGSGMTCNRGDYSAFLPTFSRVTLKMRVEPGSMPP